METILNTLRPIRASIMKVIRPKSGYSLLPISTKFGFDRGTPVDRFYIESFLKENAGKIKGDCLEIHDTNYTKKFGAKNVTRADALDFDVNNKQANIHGDLRNLSTIASNSYDTIILTHTLGVIDDFQSAINECYRVLKPGGTILVTVSAIGVAQDVKMAYWRFTETSLRYSFEKCFKKENIEVKSYGNVLAGQAFWVGLAAEELKKEELVFNDPRYAVVVALVAQK